jgi:hypothetical protein
MDVILAAIEAAMNEQQKKTQAPAAQAPVPAPVTPRAVAPQRVAPDPVRPAQTSPPMQHPQPVPAAPLQGMFADGNSLLRAIIAAEVLGPPPSLKEHHFWSLQPNEPSI